MAIGDSFPYSVPVVGASGTQYAEDVNDVLTEIISRVSNDVPFSALSGSALDMGNVPIQNAQYVGLYDQASSPGASPVSRITSYGGELYWVNNSGALKITNGPTLNAAGIGGIGGDYGSGNPALVTFVDLAETYKFYDNTTTSTWAYVTARGFNVAAGATSLNLGQIRYGGAATLTFTLPATLPGANNSALSIDSTGQISTGTITNDIVLSGTTKIQHGSRTLTLSPRPSVTLAGTISTSVAYTSCTALSGGLCTVVYDLPVQVGWTITGYSVFLEKGAVTAINGYLKSSAGMTGVQSTLNTTASPGVIGITQILASGLTTVVSSILSYYLVLDLNSTSDKVYAITVTYKQDA